jgi:3-dehydroquinate synthetase
MPLAIADAVDVTTPKPTRSSIAPKFVQLKTPLQPDPTYYFGNRITSELGPLLKRFNPDRVYLVTNQILLDLYGKEILQSIKNEDLESVILTIDDCEDNKSFRTLEYLCETLVEKNVSKASLIIGFGGGCLTNIAGLAAGLIFRGIHYVEMPTTLMGITDSCLSHKQAVNGKHGKNHFGMYSAPVFLFGDTHYLVSEPIKGKRAALVEGVKNGLISDADLVNYYESALQRPLEDYSELDFHELAYRMIRSKIKILTVDPTERGYGVILEYGHTFGHAVEFLTHGKIQHGFAVAKGMCIAAELGYRLGYISRQIVDLHYHLFGELLGVDLSIPAEVSVDDILSSMNSDNKKTLGGTKFVLLKSVGECLNPDGDFQVFVDPGVVRSVLTDYKNSVKP